MDIEIIKDKNYWEKFLSYCREKTFLDSWNWGEFNKNMGDKIWRLGLFESTTSSKNLIALALIIRIKARRGTFLFLPHGPNIKPEYSKYKKMIFSALLEFLKRLGEEENCSFIRVSPILERTEENKNLFKNLGFQKAPIHIHPEATWMLDINLPESELLMGMRKNTRNLIRRAEREGVKVRQENSIKGVAEISKSPKDILYFF